jgi:hypothetical protein
MYNDFLSRYSSYTMLPNSEEATVGHVDGQKLMLAILQDAVECLRNTGFEE